MCGKVLRCQKSVLQGANERDEQADSGDGSSRKKGR